MENLYIVGAGGLGREIESWFDLFSVDRDKFKLVGYLDDDPNALDGFLSDYKVIGRISDYEFDENDWIVLAISDPLTRERVYAKLFNKVKFYTIISKNVMIGKFVEIGEGSIILPNCIISTNVKIGKCVIINIGSQIGHDVSINDFCSLMPNVDLGGGVSLSKKVFIGSNATIIPQVYIADNVKIGAGSIVIRKILKSQTVFGNPAKRI